MRSKWPAYSERPSTIAYWKRIIFGIYSYLELLCRTDGRTDGANAKCHHVIDHPLDDRRTMYRGVGKGWGLGRTCPPQKFPRWKFFVLNSTEFVAFDRMFSMFFGFLGTLPLPCWERNPLFCPHPKQIPGYAPGNVYRRSDGDTLLIASDDFERSTDCRPRCESHLSLTSKYLGKLLKFPPVFKEWSHTPIGNFQRRLE